MAFLMEFFIFRIKNIIVKSRNKQISILYPTKNIMVEFRTQIKTKISIKYIILMQCLYILKLKYINVNCKIE